MGSRFMHEDKKEKQNKKYLLVWSKMMWPFYFCPFVNYFYTRHVIALSVDTLFHFHSLFNSILCPKKIPKKVIFTSQIVCVCIFSFDILRFFIIFICLSVHFDFTLSTHSDIDMNRSIDD